ncbi:MAG: hypothetical protein OHK0039_34920 [Bacteroidia bacterium]
MNIFIIGIGHTTGLLRSLDDFLQGLLEPLSCSAFVMAQPLEAALQQLVCEQIARQTLLDVREAEDGETLQPGCLYLIPAGFEAVIAPGAQVRLSAVVAGRRPASLGLFETAAAVFHKAATGIFLSGINEELFRGATAIRSAGGLVLIHTPQATWDERSASQSLFGQYLPARQMGAYLARNQSLTLREYIMFGRMELDEALCITSFNRSFGNWMEQ